MPGFAKHFEERNHAAVTEALKAGENPNQKISNWPPLILAISWGDKKLTRALLEAKPKVNIAHGKEKHTPLHLLALQLRDVDLGKQLLGLGARLEVYAGQRGYAPLHYAVLPAYMRARYGGSVPFTELLLAHGAHIDVRTEKAQMTPLHLLCRSDSGQMSADETKNALLLLRHGADINATDSDGNTPLHLAAGSGGRQLVKALLERKAKVTLDKYGNSPLHHATSDAELKDSALWQLLIDAKCDVNQKNKDGMTPFTDALSNDAFAAAKFLASRGAKKSITMPEGENPIEYAEATGSLVLAKFLSRTLK